MQYSPCLRADHSRDTTLTRSSIHACANYFRKCTTFVQGPFPEEVLRQDQQPQTTHIETELRTQRGFSSRSRRVEESGLQRLAKV
jgi:hypothetical protein